MSVAVSDLLRIKGVGVESITADETILVAIRRMSEKHIGCLPVVTKTGKLRVLCRNGLPVEGDCGLLAAHCAGQDIMTQWRK